MFRNFKTRQFIASVIWRTRVVPVAILLAGVSSLYGTAGCGGGGGSTPDPFPSTSPTTSPSSSPSTSPTASPTASPSVAPSPTGALRVHLEDIPLQTRSVRLTLARTTDGGQISTLIAVNGANNSSRDIDVPNLEAQDYDVFAFAYPTGDGTGTAQASAQSAVRVPRDPVADVSVRLVVADTDITAVSTPGYSGDVGNTFTLTAKSSTIPLLDAQTTWENRTPSVVQLSASSGTSVAATALASGTAIVVAHDAVSGKTSAPLTLSINSQTSPPTGNGTVNIR